MPERCEQELCENWGGDGLVCPCALFGLDPSGPELLLAEIFDPAYPTGQAEAARANPDSHEWLGHDR